MTWHTQSPSWRRGGWDSRRSHLAVWHAELAFCCQLLYLLHGPLKGKDCVCSIGQCPAQDLPPGSAFGPVFAEKVME